MSSMFSVGRLAEMPIKGLEKANVVETFYQRVTVDAGASELDLEDARMHLEDKAFRVISIDYVFGAWQITAEKEFDL